MKQFITERLLIKEYSLDDLADLHVVLSDPDTMSFWPSPFTYTQSEDWIRRSIENYKVGLGRFAIILKETNILIGDVGLLNLEIDGVNEYDLGYIVHSKYWKRGYGFEAAETVMKYGFEEIGLKRICANMPINHLSSRKVAEKLGMQYTKQFINKRNRNIMTCLYIKELT